MKSVIILFSLSLLGQQALAGGVKTIDNTKEANLLKSKAVHVPNGGYYITNMDDDDIALRNDNKGGRSLYPTTNSATPIQIQKIDSVTSLIEGQAQKCLSAQWTGQEDGLGVLYACVFGKGTKNQWGLRPAKQQWLLIPASVASSSSAKSTRRKSSSKAKSHSKSHASKSTKPKSTKKATAGKHKSSSKKKHGKRDDIEARTNDLGLSLPIVNLERRKSSTLGPFYICALDHLTDMKTRCLTNQKGDAQGSSALGTQLVEWQKGSKEQLWSFRKA